MEDNIKGGKKGGYDIVDEAQKVIDEYVDRYFSFNATPKVKVKKRSDAEKTERRLFTAAAAISIILGLVAAALMIWH